MASLTGSNPAQAAAARHREGPLLVVAGAGAGKTKTIAERIRLLVAGGVAPEAILAITFTNKAARELRERVAEPRVFASTFHALGVHILRQHAAKFGLNRHFTIFDKNDSLREIKEILVESGHDPKTLDPRRVLGAVSRAKGDGLTRARYGESLFAGRQARPSFFSNIVLSVWQKYDERLHRQKALDFDDLLLKTVELFEREPEILSLYQERWRYLHIDEYQDTNPVQYRLARLLAGKHRNLCVVGDADQSIYSWRGADFRNLLRFEQDYPEAKVVLLEENYRSTKTILAAANEVIKKNRERHEKNLFTNNGDGERIGLLVGWDEKEEARLIAESAGQLINRGVSPNEIAVLYRANFQSRALEEAFLRADVPYQVLGTKFFERQEIKDVLGYLRAALNPDDIQSWKRVINSPPRGLGKVTLLKIFSGQEADLPEKTKLKLGEFKKNLAGLKAAAASQKPSELIKTVIEQSGLGKMWRAGASDDQERLENAKELATLALKYDPLGPSEGLERLLDDAALATDQDSLDEKNQKRDGVKLMTVHAAKGLEFGHVFIVGLEENLFPHRGFDDDPPAGGRDAEEERRLFYVALTRAKEKLYLSYAQIRTIYGSRQATRPSEFIGDIPASLMEADPPAGGDPVSFIDF